MPGHVSAILLVAFFVWSNNLHGNVTCFNDEYIYLFSSDICPFQSSMTHHGRVRRQEGEIFRGWIPFLAQVETCPRGKSWKLDFIESCTIITPSLSWLHMLYQNINWHGNIIMYIFSAKMASGCLLNARNLLWYKTAQNLLIFKHRLQRKCMENMINNAFYSRNQLNIFEINIGSKLDIEEMPLKGEKSWEKKEETVA